MHRAAGSLLLAAFVLAAICPAASSSRPSRERFARSFVTRVGRHLAVGGAPFRFGGANVEWLGLVGYGPFDPAGPHYPSHYEVDDALTTARELGATVVRSQTLADSVGCSDCVEPALGVFNDSAFAHIDFALQSARAHGVKLIPTIVGDDAREGGTGCVYLRWRGIDVPGCSLIKMQPFWTDQTVIGDVEQHIAAVLDHVNVYTGVAYKDDPTILGWDLLNGGGSPTPWTREIVRFVSAIDKRHLILSAANNAGLGGVDACVAFVYPHWLQPLSSRQGELDACKKANKPFLAYEYGWDRTNYPTRRAFRAFLAAIEADHDIAGDAFWALQAHADGHGWMPIPADTTDPTSAVYGESGQWWALYYPGLQTMVNAEGDMAARAQLIRAHDFRMNGVPIPPHAIPQAPTITSATYGPTSFVGRLGTRVYWQGSAGARNYSVQRATSDGGPWTTICKRCANDVSDGFVDESGEAKGAWYRVIAYNVASKPSRPSAAVQAKVG